MVTRSSQNCLLFLLFMTSLLMPLSALADVRVVNAQGEHRMGERDTREDAVRLATEVAKRNALEQVATYLESVTIVRDMDVTTDEIRSYTAGLVVVLNQLATTFLDGNIVVVKVDILAQMDTDDVARAIATLRENEDARVQLVALKKENEQLQEELNAVNQALGHAATPDQVQQAANKRKEILNRVQSNAMVSQAWTNWVLVSPVGIPQGFLNSASGLFPANPHIAIAQQIIAYRQPQGPSHLPRIGSRSGRISGYEVMPPPGDRQPMVQPGQGVGGARRAPQVPPPGAPPRGQQPGLHHRGAPPYGAPGGNR